MAMSISLVQGRNRMIACVASVVYIVSSRPSIVYRVILSQQQQQKTKTTKTVKIASKFLWLRGWSHLNCYTAGIWPLAWVCLFFCSPYTSVEGYVICLIGALVLLSSCSSHPEEHPRVSLWPKTGSR